MTKIDSFSLKTGDMVVRNSNPNAFGKIIGRTSMCVTILWKDGAVEFTPHEHMEHVSRQG